MKKFLFTLSMLIGIAYGQTIGYLRYDSVKMAKNNGTTELILENATKSVTNGVLTNTGNGRTSFILPGATTNWSLTGNSGTSPGTNFIGTTDAQDLYLKTNSATRLVVPSGGIASSTASTDSVLVTKTDGFTLGKIAKSALVTSTAISALTAATGLNTINNAALLQEWQWNTLDDAGGLKLSSSSTASPSHSKLLHLAATGTAAGAQETSLLYLESAKVLPGVQHGIESRITGASGDNEAGYFSATSGTNSNVAIWAARGSVNLGTVGTESGVLKFNGSTSGTVTIQPAATAGTWALTLPTTDGNASEFLQTNGSGVTTWASAAGSGTVNSGTQYRIGYYATTGTAISEAAAITASRAIVSDANGVPTHSTTTTTQLQYLNAATGTTGTASTNVVFSTNPTLIKPSINNISGSYNTTATAAGTTTLFVTSTQQQQFTGVTTQNCDLPDATTLIVGMSYTITNLSTGIVTIRTNGGATLKAVAANAEATVQVTNIGTAAGTWSVSYSTDLNIGDATGSTLALTGAVPQITLGTNATTLGGVKMFGNTSGYTTIKPSATAGSWDLTLPTTDGNSGEFLQTNGSGVTTWAAGNAGTVTSVSGTAARITSTGGATPVIDIDATYVGQTSLTTLGTIGTGTWQGGIVGSTYGGTGINNAGRTLTINSNSGTINFSAASKTLTVPLDASVSGTNTGDQSLASTSDATSHTATLTGGTSVQFVEGANITLTTTGTGPNGIVTIAGTAGGGTVNSGTQYRLGYYATTGTAISEAGAITASRAIVSDANGVPTHSTTTTTELQYLTGATGTTGTTTTNLVYSTSPALTTPTVVTSIVGGASFDAFNTTSTTLNLGGAATTMTIGGTPTTAITHNYSTNATAAATTKTVNIGTGGVAGSTSNINIGDADGGTTEIASTNLTKGGVVVPTISSTNTLTNKRWVARVDSTTSSATPTINTDNVDVYQLTAQTADITSFTTNLTGTPNDFDVLVIEITGTAARAITWGTSFVATTVALPTTTVTTATLTVIFQYKKTSSYGTAKWNCTNSF